mgnify:CR=1 FL=1|jgi:hypothetical protein
MSEDQAYEIYCEWVCKDPGSLFNNNNVIVEQDSNDTVEEPVEDTGSLFSNSVEGNVSLFDSLDSDRSFSLFSD